MQNNPEIEQIIENAVHIARDRHHKYVLTEHLMLSMLKHAPFRAVLEKFGTDVTFLETDVSAYLDGLTNMTTDVTNAQPRKISISPSWPKPTATPTTFSSSMA